MNPDDDDDDIMCDLSEEGEKSQRRQGEVEEANLLPADNMEGGALFTFELREGRMPQRWRNVVHKTRHSASLQQTREVVRGDRLGEELSNAVREALINVLKLHPTLRERE